MREYNYKDTWEKLLSPEIVRKLTLISEYKGEQRLFIEAHQDELRELVEIAKIQSTEASNRIEGISTADDRLKNLVQAKTTPRNRDESEIAGYRDVLNTIHENYDYIPINANYLLQLHRDLYKFLGNTEGGTFKTGDNIIREMDAEGNQHVRFMPVAAWETPDAIDELCNSFRDAKEIVDPLILDMMFILDFLCIHPFNDGNGRMSRLLTLLLLYQSGFIFDALYDSYKGVIVFCRIKEGTVKVGTKIKMMATGAEDLVTEVGYFGAGQFIPCDELSAGMVGYIAASIKNVRDTRVGDTVTELDRPCAEPLPGYKKVNPMVYCGLYPADSAKYPDLRDALEKLQVNDASLQYEPETSLALGFGFRCGFLGLLHLEIIQERLEREFNLDLVTTAPGVIYKVHKTNGEVFDLTNPSNLPDPSEIEYMEEPFVSAEIMVTSEYVGAIMKLCQERRGIYISMDYIEATRAVIKYDMPLNEIIYDFFDALKSRSRGYASFDYEMKGYVRSDLVKLDILINKEMVDALSFIVFKDSAYDRGRKMCERLKEEIPRHLFEIPIQAAVNGKVIARETVKAMRKDVLAKCYGGDISRKKKLLEKQKEGKKRMRQVGSVEVPQEAFMSVLKLDED